MKHDGRSRHHDEERFVLSIDSRTHLLETNLHRFANIRKHVSVLARLIGLLPGVRGEKAQEAAAGDPLDEGERVHPILPAARGALCVDDMDHGLPLQDRKNS